MKDEAVATSARRLSRREVTSRVTSRLTVSLAVVGLLLALLAGSASATPKVIGGTAVTVATVPWTVDVRQDDGPSYYLCTGSIVDALHIVTAAHCLFDDSGHQASPAQMAVTAGISNIGASSGADAEQDIKVSSFRIAPGYTYSSHGQPNDVAILALSQPLNLSGPDAQAIALPTPGMAYPAGVTAALAGYGVETAGSQPTGQLNRMTTTIDPQGLCGDAADGFFDTNAIVLCASSPTSDLCNGDSGGGLVTTTGTPTLIAVADASQCTAGDHSSFAYIGAPQLLQFIQGNNSPPIAPTYGDAVQIDLDTPGNFVVGAVVTCKTSGWIAGAQLAYSFIDSRSGAVLQTGPSNSFTIPAKALGATIACDVAATTAGGTAIGGTTATDPIGVAPKIRIDHVTALIGTPGQTVTIPVLVEAPDGVTGTFHACVTLPAGTGGHLCRSVRRPGSSTSSVGFSFRFTLRKTAPIGTGKVAITVTAGASSAASTALIHVQKAKPKSKT